jgi:hypothetical protein
VWEQRPQVRQRGPPRPCACDRKESCDRRDPWQIPNEGIKTKKKRGHRIGRRLFELHLGPHGLEGLFELLGLLLCRILLEHLWQRLDKLLGLKKQNREESADTVSWEKWPTDAERGTRCRDGRTSTKFIEGMSDLTSLITFAFCAVSILTRFRVKTVFSLGCSAAASAAGAAAGAAAATGAAARGTSAMLRRVCRRRK